MDTGLFNILILPIGLGLLGFIEPCSIGASLLFLRYVEGQDAAIRIAQAGIFTLTRAVFMGGLGVIAALIGTVFIGLQKAGWILLGLLYVALGVIYLVGLSGRVTRSFGPSLGRMSGSRGAIGLAILFGLNIPACAAPLLFAVLGAAAIGTSFSAIFEGFVSLGLFGIALSLPLMLAVLWAPARHALDRAAACGRRAPIAIGLLLLVLGLWSVYFGLFVLPRA
jgi:cytochrome c-type biogenesis protein